jgi:hypothetical protein
MAMTEITLRVGDLVVKERPEGTKKKPGFRFDLFQSDAVRLEVWAETRAQLLERLKEVTAEVERLELRKTLGPSEEEIWLYLAGKGACSEGKRAMFTAGNTLQEMWENMEIFFRSYRGVWMQYCMDAANAVRDYGTVEFFSTHYTKYDTPERLLEAIPEAPIPVDLDETVERVRSSRDYQTHIDQMNKYVPLWREAKAQKEREKAEREAREKAAEEQEAA